MQLLVHPQHAPCVAFTHSLCDLRGVGLDRNGGNSQRNALHEDKQCINCLEVAEAHAVNLRLQVQGQTALGRVQAFAAAQLIQPLQESNG